jgi:hydrogenase/urease accessory protein HupE
MEGVGMKRRSLFLLATMIVVFFLCPSPASAHLNSTGMGPMYDGLLHFFLSPEDIVPVVALALLAGLRGAQYGRRALFLLPASWFVGCFLGTMFQWAASWPVAAISFLVFGGLVASDAQVSLHAMTVLAGLLGLVHGWMNGAGVPWSFSLIGAYAGLVAGVFVVVALVSAFVIRLRPPWTRIAVRVAGSWIVASGLLLLGWAVRRG